MSIFHIIYIHAISEEDGTSIVTRKQAAFPKDVHRSQRINENSLHGTPSYENTKKSLVNRDIWLLMIRGLQHL